MTARDLQLEKVYVLRGLMRSGGHNSQQEMPPALGRLERRVSRGLFMVRMRMGRFRRWAPKLRYVLLGSFVREATQREIELGWPCDYHPVKKEAA
jgi:hypothetical protein